MTQSQIKWAAEHDWFSHTKDGAVVVSEQVYNEHTDTTTYVIETFTSFTELREWAGY